MTISQTFRKTALAATVAASALAMGAGAASAATFGFIPGPDVVGEPNNGVDDIYSGATSVGGYFGGALYLIGGPATVTAEYFGSEASFINTFTLGAEASIDTPGISGEGEWYATGSGITRSIAVAANSLIDFFFTYNSTGAGAGIVANGSNPDDASGEAGPNFFVTFVTCTGDVTATSGTCVDIWLDDEGASDDDNHDDMMIRLSVKGGSIGLIPVPASVPLLLTGLAGLGLISRRRQKKS